MNISHLYLDNFRGFSKTLIPFSSVNFLVGENSTGKSSVMGLVNLLSSPDFWFSQNFNLSGYEFGGFRDILSATASSEAEFAFGTCAKRTDSRDKTDKPFYFLACYNERDALPAISFFGRLHGCQLLAVKRTKKTWKYRTAELPPDTSLNNPSDAFNILHTERHNDESGYSDAPKAIPSQAGVFPMLTMLESVATHGKADPHEFLFPIPLLGQDMAWLAPIRTKPKRTYDGYGTSFSPEGEHTPYLLRKKLSAATEAEPFRAALESFGKASGLFTTVEIHKLGKDAAAPFELLIRLLPSYPLRINSVGYGISQVLPLVVEMLARGKHSWFAIQQPEVHLHPRAQAALGDLIFQMADKEQKHFLVETHSDFTIDRFRMNCKRNPARKTTSQILFFERQQGRNLVYVLPIRENGEYPDDQPSSFRDFFLKEQMDLLGL